MTPNHRELIRLGAQLYKQGVELEMNRKKLKSLVDSGTDYHSVEMGCALREFLACKEKWEETERLYLSLRKELTGE